MNPIDNWNGAQDFERWKQNLINRAIKCQQQSKRNADKHRNTKSAQHPKRAEIPALPVAEIVD
jgi:hypothetical protein